MDNTLFGIPLTFWGIGCLAIALVYYQIWPMPNPKRARARSARQHLVLRYFHSLVWVLLAAGCFLAGLGYGTLGWVLALCGLPTYAIFLVVLLQDRQREMADEAAARRQKSETAAANAAQTPPSEPTTEA